MDSADLKIISLIFYLEKMLWKQFGDFIDLDP